MGDNDDKPFACTAEGCGMRFTNEDHLTVHKKKHEMSLNLSTGNSIKNNSSVFVDQTPTPTRFIRNCEEVGLFLDLQNVNPFDEQFKKAIEIAKNGGNNISDLNGGSDSDTLNTPSMLVLDSDLVVSTTTCTENGEILSAPRSSSQRSQSSSAQPSSTTIDSEDEDICVMTASSLVREADDNLSSESILTTRTRPAILSKGTRVIKHGQSSVTSLVTQSPLVSTAAVNSTQVLQIPTVASTAEPALTSLSATTVVSQPTPVIASATTVVQLLLKLPDGRSVPVQIPAVPVAPSTAIVVSSAQSTAATSTITSLAKMKLKETLIQNQQSSVSTTSSNISTRVFGEAIEVFSSSPRIKTEDIESVSSPESLPHSVNKRRKTDEDDPDEKRRRFLERNRAAATRCRLKRKQWIQALEKKADELSGMNHDLQNEVKLLRNEVAQLKTLLLAHKDCPVTLQQQAVANQIEGTQANHILLDSIKTIQITSAEAIASTALTNMAHTITSEPPHILPIDIVIETDPLTMENHMQDNSNNDIDK